MHVFLEVNSFYTGYTYRLVYSNTIVLEYLLVSTLTAKFDAVQKTAKPSTNDKVSLGVSYVGKNTSPAGKSAEDCVATAFGEADKKFTNNSPPIRWRTLHKLLRNLNSGLDKVTASEIVIVMTRTGAATWN